MAKLYIKKFKLIADGIKYTAGDIAELPDDIAQSLAESAPDSFEVLEASNVEAEETAVEGAEDGADDGVEAESAAKQLGEMKVAELKALCLQKGIAVKSSYTKDKLIALLEEISEADEEAVEDLEGLPPVDLGGLVK